MLKQHRILTVSLIDEVRANVLLLQIGKVQAECCALSAETNGMDIIAPSR